MLDLVFGDVVCVSLVVDSKGLIGIDGCFKKFIVLCVVDLFLKASVESNTFDVCSSESAGIFTVVLMMLLVLRLRCLSVFGDDVVSIMSKCWFGGGLCCSKALSVVSVFGCVTLRDSFLFVGVMLMSVFMELMIK